MRKFKKATAVLLAAAMSLCMVACDNKKDEKTTDTTAVSESASNTDVVEGDSEEKTENPVIEDDGDWSTTEVPVVEDNRFTTVEGADAIGVNFDDDTTCGFVSYTNGGKYELYAENGELVCDISNVGTLEHSNQVYFDGFTMAKGCVYTISFDVSCTIDRHIDWRVQINGGDYHAYSTDRIEIGPDKKTITTEFTMEDNSDPAPRFVLNMGDVTGDESGLEPHKIYVDNVSLFVTDSSNAEKIVGAPTPIQVKVNQIGYAPSDEKTVITSSGDDEKFKIVDAETEETVYIGQYGDLLFDKTTSSNIKVGDFTDFSTPGIYKIISSPSGASYDFEIGDNLYDEIYKDVVLMLYNQRCGTELDSNISGEFAHPACHMDEAVIYGDTSGKTVDVSGGWHDAGDYGRYVVSGAKTIKDLFLAYEDYAQDSDSIGIPESGNGVPDLLDEARYELEWMLKMQDEATGGVYHKVTGLVFPETVLAVDETEQMVLAPISYAATADFVAVMAEAKSMYEDIDGDFAAKCMAAALKGAEWLAANEPSGYKNPEEIVTGEYPDGKLGDEKLWAYTELYRMATEGAYYDEVKEAIEGKYTLGLGWAEVGTYALYDLAKGSTKNGSEIDDTLMNTARDALLAEAAKQLEKSQAEVYNTGLSTNYPWGSNMTVANNGMLLLMAYNMTGDEAYLSYARKQRDYLFGVNGVGYCYVTGYGDLSPVSIHHRPSQVLEKTMPGMLVGGADSNREDPYAAAVLYGVAAGLCYVDNSQSFSCNEVTIYWNSPLIYLLAGVN